LLELFSLLILEQIDGLNQVSHLVPPLLGMEPFTPHSIGTFILLLLCAFFQDFLDHSLADSLLAVIQLVLGLLDDVEL
jgi:hypothetical protein